MEIQDQTLQEILRRVLSVGGPYKVILFGSRARDEAKPGSDYDLLVIEPSDLPRYRRAAKYRKVLTGVCAAKDIVVWTPEEVAEWQNVPSAFITTAVSEGIVLYERQV